MEVTISQKRRRTLRNVTLHINKELCAVVLPRMERILKPSYSRQKGSQKPDAYETMRLKEGILHISEAKNYRFEKYEDSLRNELVGQTLKRLHNSIGNLVSSKVSHLDQQYQIRNLDLDFYIELKGHYSDEHEREERIEQLRRICEESVEELRRKATADLLDACKLRFYFQDTVEFEDALRIISSNGDISELRIQDMTRTTLLSDYTFSKKVIQ